MRYRRRVVVEIRCASKHYTKLRGHREWFLWYQRYNVPDNVANEAVTERKSPQKTISMGGTIGMGKNVSSKM